VCGKILRSYTKGDTVSHVMLCDIVSRISLGIAVTRLRRDGGRDLLVRERRGMAWTLLS